MTALLLALLILALGLLCIWCALAVDDTHYHLNHGGTR